MLLEEINNKVSEVTRKSKYWPQNAAQLGNRSARGTVAEGQGLHRRAPAQRRARHHHHPTEELGEHLLKRRSRKNLEPVTDADLARMKVTDADLKPVGDDDLQPVTDT